MQLKCRVLRPKPFQYEVFTLQIPRCQFMGLASSTEHFCLTELAQTSTSKSTLTPIISCEHEIVRSLQYQEKEAQQNQRILVPSRVLSHVWLPTPTQYLNASRRVDHHGFSTAWSMKSISRSQYWPDCTLVDSGSERLLASDGCMAGKPADA